MYNFHDYTTYQASSKQLKQIHEIMKIMKVQFENSNSDDAQSSPSPPPAELPVRDRIAPSRKPSTPIKQEESQAADSESDDEAFFKNICDGDDPSESDDDLKRKKQAWVQNLVNIFAWIMNM